jgi:hypothetical protein
METWVALREFARRAQAMKVPVRSDHLCNEDWRTWMDVLALLIGRL